MDFPADEIEELKGFGEVSSSEEAGVPYFLILQLKLPDGCEPSQCDALLCPVNAGGYASRLFFAQRIHSPKSDRLKLNWNATDVRLLERNWHAYSWNLPERKLRLAQLVTSYLKQLGR